MASGGLRWVLGLLALLPLIQAHQLASSHHAFPIDNADGSRHVSVAYTAPDGAVFTCGFDYTTTEGAVEHAQPTPSVTLGETVDNVLARLDGLSVTQSGEYWTITATIGKGVRQFHGSEQYVLGKAPPPNTVVAQTKGTHRDPRYVYDGGDECKPMAKSSSTQRRKTTLSFACADGAAAPFLAKFDEPRVCEYAIVIASPVLCGDSRFPKIKASAASVGPAARGPGVSQSSEDWFLDLAPLVPVAGAATRVVCSVYSVEQREAEGSQLHFRDFQLSISEVDAQGTLLAPGGAGTPAYTARRPDRVPLEQGEVALARGQLASGSQFRGSLAYLKLYH